MAIKDLMKAAKADRYTADGRDQLNEALQADVEDRTYKTGEISQKTGLQKQPDGSWAPPKETKYGKVQQNKEGKWGVQQKLGKGSQFIEHKNEKDASKALANYTAGYNTTERSKQDPHSNEARQIKQWNKETEKIAKGNNAERRAEHAAQFQSKPDVAKEIAEHKEAAQYYKRKAHSFSETDPSYSTYMKKAEEYENKAKELEENKPAAAQGHDRIQAHSDKTRPQNKLGSRKRQSSCRD